MRITPKTNWTSADPITITDLNRIESNQTQAFSELDIEAEAIREIIEDDYTFSGIKSFSGSIKCDTIESRTGTAVYINGIKFENGNISGVVWGA